MNCITVTENGVKQMKIVLVTGGSRGIGAECVRAFAKKGYKVYFTYKNSKAAAERLAAETGAASIMADVASADDMRAAADIIGKADIIVNNAGVSQIKLFQDITESDWDKMFDVNIKGMYITVKTFLSGMINQKYGRIINIASMWGEEGGSCEVHYSASKAAVIGFTKSLAKELGPSGITVNCVSPGVIATEMNAHLSDETEAELAEQTPLCRLGSCRDVADAVLYLASDGAGFITGAVLPVNGGIVM